MKLSLLHILIFIFGCNCIAQEKTIDYEQSTMVTIRNKFLTAKIKQKGAELISLRKENKTEYIWQANPEFWDEYSPILFPIVGSLKNDEYIFEGKHYQMPQHGFAKDMIFNLKEQSKSSVSFSFTSNQKTLRIFPFDFELLITYRIIKNNLKVSYKVINIDSKMMYFSIGGHPGFNIPIQKDSKRSDYQLVFNRKENAQIHLKSGKLRTGKKADFLNDTDRIRISNDLFDQGALIFSNLTSDRIKIEKNRNVILSLEFKGFPYLGIWSRSSDSPFICIEPWYGLTDLSSTNQSIEEKEGIVILESGKEFKANYKIELHN